MRRLGSRGFERVRRLREPTSEFVSRALQAAALFVNLFPQRFHRFVDLARVVRKFGDRTADVFGAGFDIAEPAAQWLDRLIHPLAERFDFIPHAVEGHVGFPRCAFGGANRSRESLDGFVALDEGVAQLADGGAEDVVDFAQRSLKRIAESIAEPD